MGTNFYWVDPDKIGVSRQFDSSEARHHIGKRSAAGWFCWDCNIPLVQGGDIHLVHTSREAQTEVCPKCGQGKPVVKFEELASAVELGFAPPHKGRKTTGVSSCSSFSWGQDPAETHAICEKFAREQIIVDEYGQEMTGEEFLSMIFANCPIQFTHSIGVDFS